MFETKRLILRPIESGDADWFIKIYGNPRIMKTIYNGDILTEEQARNKFNGFLNHWKEHQFGVWMILEKFTQAMVGYCVFRYFEEENLELIGQIELGYILDEPFWGKGYATEAVISCLKIGFERHHFNHVFATILPQNTASKKVILKAGMQYKYDLYVKGLTHHIYEMKKQDS